MKLTQFFIASAAIAVCGSAVLRLICSRRSPITESQLFDFEGLYVGGTGGGAWMAARCSVRSASSSVPISRSPMESSPVLNSRVTRISTVAG